MNLYKKIATVMCIFIFVFMFVVDVSAQVVSSSDIELIYNNITPTMKNRKVLKIDTSYSLLGTLDTTDLAWQSADTTGAGSSYGIFDSLSGKNGAVFYVKVASKNGTPSNDTIYLYGEIADNWIYSRTASTTTQKETLTWGSTAGYNISKYQWINLDTVLFNTGVTVHAGMDSAELFYRSVYNTAVADSLSQFALGVLLGADRILGNGNDTIASGGLGYAYTKGKALVYASSGNYEIFPGDYLMCGNGGRLIKYRQALTDTVFTNDDTTLFTMAGAQIGDLVFLSKMGEYFSDTADTLGFRAQVTAANTVSIIGLNTKNNEAPTTSFVDSLSIMVIPAGGVLNSSPRIVAKSLGHCNTDSTLLWVEFNP